MNLLQTNGLSGALTGERGTPLPDGEAAAWEDCWFDLKAGDEVMIYHYATGQIDLLRVKSQSAGTVAAVTGWYEDPSPNTAAPGTITALGASFPVTDQGRDALKGYAIGDQFTLTLDRAGRVIDARAAGNASMIGVLKSASADRVEVELLSNVTVSGASYGTISSTLVGKLVKVSSPASGELSASALSYTGGSLEGRTAQGAGGGDALGLALADHLPLRAGIQQGHIQHHDMGAHLFDDMPPLGQDLIVIAPNAVDGFDHQKVSGAQPPVGQGLPHRAAEVLAAEFFRINVPLRNAERPQRRRLRGAEDMGRRGKEPFLRVVSGKMVYLSAAAAVRVGSRVHSKALKEEVERRYPGVRKLYLMECGDWMVLRPTPEAGRAAGTFEKLELREKGKRRGTGDEADGRWNGETGIHK